MPGAGAVRLRHGRGRWSARPRRLVSAGVGLALVAALTSCQPPPVVLQLVVTTAADGTDATPGDGVCEVTGGAGDCSLRAAISEANATAGFDRITITSGIDPVLTVPGTGEEGNATGDLDPTSDIAIVGNGATLDAAGTDRALDVHAGHLQVTDLTITGGAPPRFDRGGLGGGAGAGIRVDGKLSLTAVRVVGNRGGQSTEGAGIWVAGGSVSLRTSTISDNTFDAPGGSGGGIFARGATVVIRGSTVAANHREAVKGFGSTFAVLSSTLVAEPGPGGLSEALDVYQGTAVVIRSTLSRPGPSEGFDPLVYSLQSTIRLAGSVLDAPGAFGLDLLCNAPLTSDGWNVASASSCGLDGPGDLQGQLALLGPVTDNGGTTLTQLPHAGSPVIDHIPAGTPTLCDGVLPVDQRGVARPDGPGCDAGAVEGVGPPAEAIALTVDDASDAVDVAPGDRTCATATSTCTLRAAVMEANATNANIPNLEDTITIQPGVDPSLTRSGRREDSAVTGDLDVTGALSLVGHGATIDGGALDRVLHALGPRLALSDLTITGGDTQTFAASDGGGAGIAARGALVLTDVTITGNRADDDGGGIESSSTVTATRSEVSANVAGGDGGGVAARDIEAVSSTFADNRGREGGGLHLGSGSLVASTVSGNVATARGGGVAMELASGPIELTTSTVSGNSAPTASAIAPGAFLSIGVVLTASTVVGNTGSAALDTSGTYCTLGCLTWQTVSTEGSILVGAPGFAACDGPISASLLTLAPDGSCGSTLAGDALLGPLADNGGPTRTHLPQPGSGAIDTVPVGASGCDGSVPTDQRGVARPSGPACDVGSVEQA